MDVELNLRLFGGVEIEQNGQPVSAFRTSKAQALLCYLAVTGQTHTRPALAGLLWGELPEASARMNLSKTLTNLRRLVGAHLDITRQAVAFNQEAPYQLDVETFTHYLSHGSAAPTIEQLGKAVDLYRGDFLAEVYVHQAPAFEAWVLSQRARLRELALQALHTLAGHFTQQGEYSAGIDYVTRLLALEPWREEAHRQLMRLLALKGQRSAALAQFETCRQLLAEELGVEPGPETKELYEHIRTGKLAESPPESWASQAERASPPATLSQPSPLVPLSLPPFLAAPPAQPASTAPVVAREHELAQLDHFLKLALTGQGRVVFVTGVAGLGKTVLVETFADQAQQKHADLIVVSGRCNAYGDLGDPYLPFREVLEMLTGDLEAKWAAGVIAREQARRLWAIVPDVVRGLLQVSPDLIDIFVPASSLATPAAAVAPPDSAWPEQLEALVSLKATESQPARLTQNALFMQYTKLLQRLAGQKPLLLLLDDLQWADAGSISLLFHLGQRLAGQRILVVGIYRPDEIAVGRPSPLRQARRQASPAKQDRHPLQAAINEFQRLFGPIHIDLGQAEGRPFVDALIDIEPNRLGETFRQALYRQTAGHALFTVEMLRSLQERGVLMKDEQGYWIEGPGLNWDILPARVEGTIKERIDRLPASFQETLRIASIEGETCTAEVIAQVQAGDARQVVRQLGELDRLFRLMQSQGSRRTTAGGQRLSFYRFRHILFQRYLYNSLDNNERVYLHEAVGQALETLYGAHTEPIAVRLAHHFREAALPQKAIHYLQRAGQQAVRNYANHAAIIFFNEALALLKTLPETPEQTRLELSLQLAIIPPLIATQGYAAPAVGQASTRARALCPPATVSPELFYALRALWACHFVGADLAQANQLSRQLLSLAQELSDPAFLLDAHHALGGTFCILGQFAQSRRQFEQAIALYKPQQHRAQVLFFGPDLGVFCYSWLAHPLCHLGYLDQARRSGQAAVHLAQSLDDPFSLALALAYGAMLQQFSQAVATTKEWAERAIAVCREHDFVYYLAWARILQGWAQARQKAGEEAIRQIRRGWQDLSVMEAGVREPYYLALLAEAQGQAGQVEAALDTLDEALANAARREEHWYEAELHRLRGEILQQKQADEADIEACFHQAIEMARQRQGKWQELRATMSLSRLWQKQGRQEAARQLLAETYGWFSEGFDTPVLKQAGALLAELEAGP